VTGHPAVKCFHLIGGGLSNATGFLGQKDRCPGFVLVAREIKRKGRQRGDSGGIKRREAG
jgi:hypothetical protein